MPKLDGAGPRGQGAGSGRGMGNCGAGPGMGFGGGRGRGQACCNGFARGPRNFISAKNELDSLELREKALEAELTIIREEKSALKASEK